MKIKMFIFGSLRTCLLSAVLGLFMGGAVLAAGLPSKDGGLKDPPVPPTKLELSANAALTTDYVFRGFSQTAENAAIQGGFDATHGIFYAGVWASNLDFGGNGAGQDVANIEIDWYAVSPRAIWASISISD